MIAPDLFADVALRATLDQGRQAVLTYRVPERLAGLVRPGQLVWAPLRQRQVQGVVLGLRGYQPGDEDARELERLGDGEAFLTQTQLDLARWLARYYRAPLYDVLALLLPPGSAQESETTWRASAPGMNVDLGTLPERERAILYFLRTHGETGEKTLRSVLRGSDADLREAYVTLHQRALVIRGSATTAPKARPRHERTARLLLSAAELPAAFEALQRAPKQAAVLNYLVATGTDPAPPPTTLADTQPQPTDSVALPYSAVATRQLLAATGATSAMLRTLEQRGYLALEQREVRRDPLGGQELPPDEPPQLTEQQQAAFAAVRAALDEQRRETFLLHGVTGSGKTELYLRAIARALRLGRQTLVLVPEIALTTQLVRRFAARFPGQLAVLHSKLSLGERYDEWRRLRRGQARIAIGSRSAVFAPLPELGLIIVDEEHEPSYKHDHAPRYHARDVALKLANLCGAVVILGSATPAVETYERARQGKYQLLEMPERVAAGASAGLQAGSLPLPLVQLVDMRKELQHGNRSIFSMPLQQALDEALARGEQGLLFLNRRGSASFVMCRDCGHVLGCPRCSSPLTLHFDEAAEATAALRVGINPPGIAPAAAPQTAPDTRPSLLICHSCNHRELLMDHCPNCWSLRIRHFGVGTQRVAEELEKMLPGVRVQRWDRDSVTKKDSYQRLLDAFLRREADVIVGTQMVAKGLDLPGVTVVGVVAADSGLRLPDFRSSERTFQLLTQVAGRAGRRSVVGRVVIQSYSTEHYALQAAREHDYAAFYQSEIAFRRQLGYPPFSRLVRFVISASRDERCERAAHSLAERIQELAPRLKLGEWGIIGPAPCFLRRVRERYRWQLVLRADNPAALLDALGPLPGWMVDIDPVQLL